MRARQPRRSARVRAPVRTRDRRRGRGQVRVDVRQRADPGLRGRGAEGRDRAPSPRRRARSVPGRRFGSTSFGKGEASLAPTLNHVPRAVVLSAVRTPIGRYGGALSDVRPDDLAATAIAAAVERAGVDPPRSTTCTSAARTRRARTTATSRAWPCCSPGSRTRSRASPSTACARRGSRPSSPRRTP